MFRLFGYREFAKLDAARPGSPAPYADALLASWVSPPPDMRRRQVPAARGSDDKSDIAAFLDRVYRNQEC